MNINENLNAMDTYNKYAKNNNKLASAIKKLSSGLAVNSAADNAASLAISEKMRGQIRGLRKANGNTEDAISLLQVADGALRSATEVLQRMREIAVQAASDTNTDSLDRAALQDEFSQLQSELDDIGAATTYNKKNLLNGSLSASSSRISNVNMINSGLAVGIGDAAAGDYTFSASMKLETAAVIAADAEGTASVGSDARTAITNADVMMGVNAGGTAMYNGNYPLKAVKNAGTGSLTVSAAGDNGLIFTCTLAKNDIDGKTTFPLNFESSAGAGDAFTLNLNLFSAVNAGNTNALDALGTAIGDVVISVNGGVDAAEPTYGIYAECTGAEPVRLEVGMDAVTFSNGVAVTFKKLTAADLDTTYYVTKGGIVIRNATGFNWHSNPYVDISTLTLSGDPNLGTQIQLLTGCQDIYLLNESTTNMISLPYGCNDGNAVLTGVSGTIKVPAGPTQFVDTTEQYATIDLYGRKFTANVENSYNLNTGASVNVTFYDKDRNSFTLNITSNGDNNALGMILGGVELSFSSDNLSAGIFTYATNTIDNYSAMLTADECHIPIGGTVTATYNGTDGHYFTLSFKTGYPINNNVDMNHAFYNAKIDIVATPIVHFYNYMSVFGDSDSDSGDTASHFKVAREDNAGLLFHVGANSGDELPVNLEPVNCRYLGIGGTKVDTRKNAADAITTVDAAVNKVSAQRAFLGAVINRLNYKINNLDVSAENLTGAESIIRDVDMAKETIALTNARILQQSAAAMLAQANSKPETVLALLGLESK